MKLSFKISLSCHRERSQPIGEPGNGVQPAVNHGITPNDEEIKQAQPKEPKTYYCGTCGRCFNKFKKWLRHMTFSSRGVSPKLQTMEKRRQIKYCEDHNICALSQNM